MVSPIFFRTFAGMTEQITSLQNPKIKLLTALQQKSSERRRTGLFVVEGQQELQHCIRAGYEVDTVFWCPELCPAVLPPEKPSITCSKQVWKP